MPDSNTRDYFTYTTHYRAARHFYPTSAWPTPCCGLARMSTSTAQPVNIICPDGDLLLRLTRKGNESLLLVSSKVMTKASGTFFSLLQLRRRLMTQPFAFTSPMHELRLPEDDGDAFLTICNILHDRHQEVPAALSLGALKNIASSCNRHQLTSALSAWSPKWLTHASSQTLDVDPYIVVAIAVDLGISPIPVSQDARQSCQSKLRDIADQNLAGWTGLPLKFPVNFVKLTRGRRWPPLSEDAGNVKSCCRTSKLLLGHVPRVAQVQ